MPLSGTSDGRRSRPDAGEVMRTPLAADECLDRAALESLQLQRLRQLISTISGFNPFYTRKLQQADVAASDLQSAADVRRLPFTTKAELAADQEAHGPWGTALSEPIDRYTRYCQTSSTTGRPLKWCDTNESWQWMLECWKAVYRAAGVGPSDRVLFPFSFGPFLGFWAAFDAAHQIGAHAIPAGGMSSHLRLAMIDSVGPTVVCCTPTYALRLAEVAASECQPGDRPLSGSSVRVIVVAGEPGGNIPATRERIETLWGARVIDHHGLTETGPASFECWERPGGLHLLENQFLAEVIDPVTTEPVADGQLGELVLTNFGRVASPVIRYRTGDLVSRRLGTCVCGRTLAWLEGGILSRSDDMVAVRGVNVYPAAIEAVIRQYPEIAEFRSTVRQTAAMRTLDVEIELLSGYDGDVAGVVTHVSQGIREALGLTVPVHLVASGALPRFDMKARRFIVEGK
jgi:phenylacetate-CoA ligase